MDEPAPISSAAPPSARPTPLIDPHRQRRVTLAAGLALCWGIFTLLAQLSGALDAFEEPLLDWRVSLHAYPSPPSDQLALVAIDNIPDEHPWPWSRFDYSLALRSMIDYAPQSVVFEMNLNDRDTEYTSFDDTFSHIVQRAGTVVFAATALVEEKKNAPLPKVTAVPFNGNVRQVPRFNTAVWPLDTFAGSSPVGVNNLESEAGLRLRRLPLVFMVEGKMVPSLVLQAAATLLGADLASSEVQVGRAILLKRKDGKVVRTVPIDDQGRMRIRFHQGAATSWQASFDNILVYDEQLQNGITPEVDLHKLLRRQIWIGRTDPAEHQRYRTAVGTLSRAEIEIQAERTILEQDYLRPLPPMILALLYLLIAIAGAAAVIRLGPIHAAALLIILGAFWLESSVLAFRVYNIILPLPSFALLLFGTFAVGLLATVWDLDPEVEEQPKVPLRPLQHP